MAHAFALGSTISRRSISEPRLSGGAWRVLGCVWRQVAPAIDPSHPDLAAGDQPKQQQLRRLRRGQRPLRLHPPAEFPIEPLNHVRRPERLPLTPREAVEGQQVLTRFFQTLDDLGRARAPRTDKRPVGLPCGRRGSPRRRSRDRPSGAPRSHAWGRAVPDSAAYGPCSAAPPGQVDSTAARRPGFPSITHSRGRRSPLALSPSSRPCQAVVASLVSNSRSRTTFCPSARTPSATTTGAVTTFCASRTRSTIASRSRETQRSGASAR